MVIINHSNLERLKSLLAQKIAEVSGEESEKIFKQLQTPKNPEHGELAYALFDYGKKNSLPPPVAAGNIKEVLKLPDEILSCTAVGPFLNFTINKPVFVEAFLAMPTKAPEKNGKRIVVEYSSPNIAKPFHVGHLRATLIGNALDRIYRYCGYDVISINHLGDWGTQFGFVWAGCKLWGKPENATVTELVDLYRKATSLKAEQEKTPPSDPSAVLINELARSYFRDLEEGLEYATEFWKWCLSISMEYFSKTYARLNVSFDYYTGESFYSDKLPAVRELLEKKGVLTESNGALGVELGDKLGFARIATPDGRSLYLTRDLATAKYRAETFNFDKSIYVVGTPQTLHFEQLISIFKLIGSDFAEKLIHVAFGSVLGMKTRGDGEFVELNDFLDEATSRALDAYHSAVSKRPEGIDENSVSASVGLSAIVVGTLNRQRLKDVQFSWETALAFAGESGPYLLYSIARLNSVIEKAKDSGITTSMKPTFDLFKESEAYYLAVALDEFNSVLQRTSQDNEPSFVTSYALDLAKLFSKAYLVLRVVGEEEKIASARLCLFIRTREILVRCCELLGLPVVERM